MSLTEELKHYAKEIGVVAVGVTGPETLRESREIYRTRVARGFLTGGRTPRPGFEPPDVRSRFDPRRTFRKVESVVCIAVPYNVEYSQPVEPQYPGQVARVAWGRDYHLVVAERLRKLTQFLKDADSGLEAVSMVDTGALLERGFAWRAGIGWIGKNNTLIVPGVGSFVFLGEILVNRRLQRDRSLDRDCGSCKRCVDACPTGALVEPHILNTRVCLSFLTQVAEVPPDDILSKLGGRLYGCDICQEVCPFNKAAPKIGDPEFLPKTLMPRPDLLEVAGMDAKRYLQTVGDTSAEWVGRTVLQKNALLGLARHTGAEVQGAIDRAKEDLRPAIRQAAATAERLRG